MDNNKIYTKVGDKGNTRLANGEVISKSNIRIESYGTIDELNSQLGLLIASLVANPKTELRGDFKEPKPEAPARPNIIQMLTEIQNELFSLGAELASKGSKPEQYHWLLRENATIRLEQEMDCMSKFLSPLKNFILPGGSVESGLAHICRTVCRRAERQVKRLSEEEPDIRQEVQVYLNRLSDWFFILARYMLMVQKIDEVIWSPTH